MTDATSTSASSSSASVIDDIVRLIAPSDRPGFHEMLQHELGGRELLSHKMRRVGRNSSMRKSQMSSDCVSRWTHGGIVCSTPVGSELAIDPRVIKVVQHKSLRRTAPCG